MSVAAAVAVTAMASTGLLLAGCAKDPVSPGAAGAGTGGTGGPAATVTTGTFALAWEDNFDAFDATRWQLMTHTWDGNLAQFSTANTTFENGVAKLLLTAEPADTVKPFRGVEMRSKATVTYGKIEARMKLAKGSGVVSSLVTIYTPWPADDWNELDIEYLGQYPDRVQFNEMIYTGAPTKPPVAQSVSPTQFPMVVALDFDPSADFHDYTIEWTPAAATFSVDGAVKHTWSAQIARLKLPQNILLTIWASSASGWAGPIQGDSAPTSAQYDWIRVYDWKPDAP